jgi:hypothetical protein
MMLNGNKNKVFAQNYPNARGLDLIRRYALGEELNQEELSAMRATMYLLAQYARPARDWQEFQWQGPEHFIREIWPVFDEETGVANNNFADGTVSP